MVNQEDQNQEGSSQKQGFQDDPKVLDLETLGDHKVVVKIAGQEVEKTLKQVIDDASKAEGANAKFREAHDIRAAAERSLDVEKDLKEGFAENDPAKLKRGFVNLGLTPEQVEQLFAASDPQQEAVLPGDGSGEGSEDGEDPRDARMAQLEKQVGVLSGAYQKNQKAQEARGVLKEVDAAIDRDPGCCKILEGLDTDPSAQDFVRKTIRGFVSKASEKTPWGPRAIAAGIQDAKDQLKAIGVGGKPSVEGDEDQGGQADEGYYSSDSSLVEAAGRTHGSSTSLHPSGKQGKPVPPGAPGYNESLFNRLARGLRRGG